MTISSEDYAYISKDVYKDDAYHVLGTDVSINGHKYKIIDSISTSSGYQARAYQRTDTGEVVIAERGTEPTASDAITDLKMVRDQANQQWPDAQKFAEHAMTVAALTQSNFVDPIDITVTGHSLGGTLAELTAAKYHLYGETFNSYGAVDLIYGFHPDSANVVNHVMAGDVVSAASHHVGITRHYATETNVAGLHAGHYLDGRGRAPNPLLAMRLGDHGIGNFAPGPGQGESALSASNEARYARYHVAVDQFRNDIHRERSELGEVLRRADSRDLESTYANLPPHIQQQLLEYHAVNVDARIQNAVEHHPFVEGTERQLDQATTVFQAGGHQAQLRAEQTAKELHAAGLAAQHGADELSRGTLRFVPVNPLVAAGAALGAQFAGHVVHGEAEAYAQASQFAGQAMSAAGDDLAERARTARQGVAWGSHAASVAAQGYVHFGEAAIVAATDTGIKARDVYEDTKAAVSQGINAAERTAAHAYDTLTHPGSWFREAADAPRHDPRRPDSPDHALFTELRERFPTAGENRLLQFTAVCRVNGIDERNLQTVHFDQRGGTVTFASGGLLPEVVTVDVKQPSPPPQQSIRQLQQSDQQQALSHAAFQAQQAQIPDGAPMR